MALKEKVLKDNNKKALATLGPKSQQHLQVPLFLPSFSIKFWEFFGDVHRCGQKHPVSM